MADPEEKSPKASADLGASKDAAGQLTPIEEEEESTMKGNLPPAVLAIMGRRPRIEKPAALVPDSAVLKSALKPDEDESSDSLTATAPHVSRPLLPYHVPGSVEIRTVEHDELLDETEVKTVPGSRPESPPSSARPAAGRPPSRHPVDEDEPTNRAPADDEPLTSPGGDAPTMPGRQAPTVDGAKSLVPSTVPTSSAIPKTHDDGDDEDSITQLSPAVKPSVKIDVSPPSGEDDSTEASAPPVVKAMHASGPAPAAQLFNDDSDGTTRKRSPPELGQIEEEQSFDSITNQDHATKIRDMAAGIELATGAPAKPVPKLNDEPEEEENATQVMANGPHLSVATQPAFPPPSAPYKKPRKPTLHGIAPPADLLPTHRPDNAPAIATVGATSIEPPKNQESESGLKIAPPTVLTTERANPAVLGNVVTTAPNLSALLAAPSSGAHAVVPPDGTPLPPPGSLSGGMLSVSSVPTTTRDRPIIADGGAMLPSVKMGAIGPVLAPDGTPLPISGAHAVFGTGPHPASVHRLSVEPPPHSHVQPSLGPPSLAGMMPHEGDLGAKVPRWGIIVGAVAAACIAFPILLYVVLNHPTDPVVVLPAELVTTPVKRADGVRTKHDKSKHGTDPVPTTSTSGKKPDPKRR